MNNPNQKKLHCPNCKSVHISISTETSIDGAVTTHGGGFSSTHVSNTHRNFWFCHDCGTKFRNLQNLLEEIKKVKKNPIVFGVLAAIFALVAVIFFIKSGDSWLYETVFRIWGYMLLVLAAVSSVFIFVSKKKFKKLIEEYNYLQVNCFD